MVLKFILLIDVKVKPIEHQYMVTGDPDRIKARRFMRASLRKYRPWSESAESIPQPSKVICPPNLKAGNRIICSNAVIKVLRNQRKLTKMFLQTSFTFHLSPFTFHLSYQRVWRRNRRSENIRIQRQPRCSKRQVRRLLFDGFTWANMERCAKACRSSPP